MGNVIGYSIKEHDGIRYLIRGKMNTDTRECHWFNPDEYDMFKIQKMMVDYLSLLEDAIGYIDENGKRKLKPEMFLSGEVAAYKLIKQWVRDENNRIDIYTDENIELLFWIETLFDDEWEEPDSIAMILWDAVMGELNEGIADLHFAILAASFIVEVETYGMNPDDTLLLNYGEGDLTDSSMMMEPYGLVREAVRTNAYPDFIKKLFQDTNLYKMHFNMFQ